MPAAAVEASDKTLTHLRPAAQSPGSPALVDDCETPLGLDECQPIDEPNSLLAASASRAAIANEDFPQQFGCKQIPQC